MNKKQLESIEEIIDGIGVNQLSAIFYKALREGFDMLEPTAQKTLRTIFENSSAFAHMQEYGALPNR